jgi:hypothetical protein
VKSHLQTTMIERGSYKGWDSGALGLEFTVQNLVFKVEYTTLVPGQIQELSTTNMGHKVLRLSFPNISI